MNYKITAQEYKDATEDECRAKGEHMGENIFNISDNSYGEYSIKLNILNKEGFNKLLKELTDEAIDRNLAGFVCYESLNLIAKTLSAFDKITFDKNNNTMMDIKNWNSLNQRIDSNMTERKCIKWVLNGMINAVAEIIDEDIMYGADNSFYKNLRDFLCLIYIKDE